MSIGAQLQLSAEAARFELWANGDEELGLGWAADLLGSSPRIVTIESACRIASGDDFFHQKAANDPGGFVRRFFRMLSKFTHGAPGFTDADLRQSNGPVFVPSTFARWSKCFKIAYSLAAFEAKVAQPRLDKLACGSSMTVAALFREVVSKLPTCEDGVAVLNSIPTGFW